VGVLWLQEDDGKLHEDVLVLLPASIAASGGRRQRTVAAARVRRVSSFAGKNLHHGGTIYRGVCIGSETTKILTLF
jgi:hypothetical protein